VQIAQGPSTASFAYDNASRRTLLALPNGVTANYTYDAASQLTGLTYVNGSTTLGNLTYGYDLVGRRVSSGGSFASNNLPNTVTTTAYNANNQLTTWGTANLYYDLNGNMTSSGTDGYTWDARDRLVSTLSGASFQYDPFGRRASKTFGGTTTSFLYDGANPVQELSGSTPTANLITGGVDEYFQRTDSAGVRSFLTDALGSTLALTDPTGTVQTSYSFDPFGNTAVSGAATTNSYAYTGRELDPSGIYFYRARYYSPSLGRFITEDPLGFAGGDANLYKYAGNDPLDSYDPYGLSYIYIDFGGIDDSFEHHMLHAPGFGESLIPVWGSARQAGVDFSCGRWIRGAFNTGLAISDIFLVKSLATAAGKGLFKIGGSHTWKQTSKWLTTTGWREFKGQPFHHWLIPQSGWGEVVPDVVKNQPFNLMGIAGEDADAARAMHNAIEGKGPQAMNLPERLWNGSPFWFKNALGHALSLAGRQCDCN
jgi:RHS repeat-associated protein